MTILACPPSNSRPVSAPDTVSPSTRPDGLTWHDHLSYEECADLLDYVRRRAQAVHFVLDGMVPVDELEDAGMRGIERSLTSWDSRYGVGRRLFAKLCVMRSIASAHRDYARWHVPTPASTRWKPPVDALRPQHSTDPETVIAQMDQLSWFKQQLFKHRLCLSPSTRQALDDFLAEHTVTECATRDGVPYERARSAQRLMLAALRRHLVSQETTCAEERAAWSYHNRGYARNRSPREVAYAAAD